MSRSVEKDSEWEKGSLSDDEQQIKTAADSISGANSLQLINLNNDQDLDIDDDFQDFDGCTVEELDDTIIEELKEDNDHYQNISEWPDECVLYEFSDENENDVNNNLKQVFFDNASNNPSEKNMALAGKCKISTEIHNFNEKEISPTSSSQNGQDKHIEPETAVKSLEPHSTSSSSSDSETSSKDSDLSNNGVEHIELDINRYQNFPGHEKSGSSYATCSSDEFADIEDNVPDSSPSDSCETHSPMKRSNLEAVKNVCQQENLASTGENTSPNNCWEYSDVDCYGSEESEKLKDEASEKIHHQTQYILHSDSEDHYENPVKQSNNLKRSAGKMQYNPRKKFVLYMPTIEEVPEKENKFVDNQTVPSQTSTLKMKPNISKTNKCGVCNVRLGLCAIRCRCGNLYCAKHRYDKEHNCTFDYKAMGAMEIRKNNPKVIADKIHKL